MSTGRMPPWHAKAAHGKFANDPRLSDAEKQLISDWVGNGMPAGDLTKLPKAKQPKKGEWRIGKPDLVLHLPQKKGTHEYKFVVDGKIWKHDPGNHRQAGHYNNSVLIVGETP